MVQVMMNDIRTRTDLMFAMGPPHVVRTGEAPVIAVGGVPTLGIAKVGVVGDRKVGYPAGSLVVGIVRTR